MNPAAQNRRDMLKLISLEAIRAAKRATTQIPIFRAPSVLSRADEVMSALRGKARHRCLFSACLFLTLRRHRNRFTELKIVGPPWAAFLS